MLSYRSLGWPLLIALALFRPGVDRFDRWLVADSWQIPSEWNRVADAAIQTGAVDGTLAGRTAPWRHASVPAVNNETSIAVVSVSDFKVARVTFITDGYESLGSFTRRVPEPSLATDEARGYKPLSHIWPLVERDDHVHTLIGFQALHSHDPNEGVFVYLAVGPIATEVLFVTRLEWGPGPTWGALTQLDLDGDAFEDLAIFERGERERAPIARFMWDPTARRYVVSVSRTDGPMIEWWTTTATHRVIIPRGDLIDDHITPLLGELRMGSSE